MESGLMKRNLLEPLHKEAEELVRVFASSQRTTRKNMNKRKLNESNLKKMGGLPQATNNRQITKSQDHQIKELENA